MAENQSLKIGKIEREHSRVPALLAFLLTIMVGLMISGYFYFKPENVDSTLTYMAGQLFTGWMVSMGYWFGTTRSSAEKNKKILDL